MKFHFNAEFKFNEDMDARVKEMRGRALAMLKEGVAQGMSAYKYVPRVSGDLEDSVEASIGTDEPFLVYTVPYAAKQYYTKNKKSKKINENATWKWFEAWKANEGKAFIEKLKKQVDF